MLRRRFMSLDLIINHENYETLLLGNVATPQPQTQSKWERILSKIWSITKKILFGLVGVAFFLMNPCIFVIGFITGIIWDKKAQEVIDKIIMIWKKQTLGMAILTGVATFFALQVTWATASFLYAANLGSMISRMAASDE